MASLKNEFVVVLNSSSCTNLFPNNCNTNFRIRLPHRLQLGRDWRVALGDISFSNALYTINKEQSIFLVIQGCNYKTIGEREPHEDDQQFIIKIEPGIYQTIDELLITINNEIRSSFLIVSQSELPLFSLDSRGAVRITTGFVTLAEDDIRRIYVKSVSPSLRQILGTERYGFPYLHACHTNIYCYCDIVNPRVVGNVTVPLLRQVDTKIHEPYGSQVHQIFRKPLFCELSTYEINEIEVQLLDDTGVPPVIQFGNVILSLIFKRF
jgi:hypothetical protein